MEIRGYYTGIGSRRTPPDICEKLRDLAAWFEREGFVLRSGGADGADAAFEAGVSDDAMKEIYLPWRLFNNNTSPLCSVDEAALKMAENFHPAWHRCKPAVRKIHARNCYQVLGKSLNMPSLFVICWTPDGKDSGGTGQALRVARAHDIPVLNLEHARRRAEAARQASLAL